MFCISPSKKWHKIENTQVKYISSTSYLRTGLKYITCYSVLKLFSCEYSRYGKVVKGCVEASCLQEKL